jgi:hypothetical protein
MASNDQLHQLVHSLTKNEQGYFKKMSVGLGRKGNNYLKLFDAIRAQETYNEPELKKKFAAQNFSRNFSMAKAYLSDAILRSLRNYHAAESTDKRVEELIDNVRICFAKGLYETGKTFLRRGKALSEKHDLFHQHLLFLQYEFRMKRHFQQDITNLLVERERISSYLSIHHQLLLHSSRVLTLLQRFRTSRTSEERAELMEILHQVQPNDDKKLPLLLRHIARETMANCYAYLGNRKMAFEVKRATLDIYVALPEQLAVYPYRYLKLLGNVLALAAESQPPEIFDEIYLCLHELLALVSGELSLKKEIEVRFGIVYHLLHGDTLKAAVLGDKERDFILYAPELGDGRRLELSHILASAHFTAKQPKQALRWIRDLLDSPHITLQPYRKKAGELFELILFYELDKLDLLENRLINILRRKDVKINPVESSLYRLLREIISQPQSKRLQFFLNFRNEIEEHIKNPKMKEFVGTIDLMLWIERAIDFAGDESRERKTPFSLGNRELINALFVDKHFDKNT